MPLVEGPARSTGSSTGFGVQEERWSLEGWFPGGFATTVILRPPMPPPEVVLVCLQPEREPYRGRGNRAPPFCRSNRAWPQLQDDHLPTVRRCLIHGRHLSMLTAQAREAAIMTITRHQVTTASRNARVTRFL